MTNINFANTAERRESAEMPEPNESRPQRAQPSEAGEQRRIQAKRHLDERLDEALEETFPASDPIAVTPPREPSSHRRRRDA